MSKIKVLLVDDEEEYVKTMAERMEMRDVGPQVALSGEEALQMLEKDVPDVMVLDLRMPGIDGMQVLERVKKEHPHVEVIILTGHGSEKEEKEARRLGAFEYLQKPADTSHLLATVRSAWAKSLKAAVEFIKDSKEEFDKSITAAVLAEAGAQEMAKETLQASTSPKEQAPAADAASEHTIKVLLVDDEEDFVRTMAERMEMRNLGSDVALDGEQALAMLEDEIPDVMVLDLRMPGIDGMEVLRRVRKAYPVIQVIIMTGHGSAEEEKEARRLGAFDYLEKPVDINDLMDAVRKAGRVRHEGAAGNIDASE
jgi:DNA-binding NtrC family response regulator